MGFTFELVEYRTLNARQQEAFNFQKVSAVLADYGFVTMRLSSDWQGADYTYPRLSSAMRKRLEPYRLRAQKALGMPRD